MAPRLLPAHVHRLATPLVTSDSHHMTAGIARWAEGFLLDFDGPVCDLFPAGSGSTIADEARAPLHSVGVVMPSDVLETYEHLAVLEFAARCAPEVLVEVERAAVAGEVAAARSAPITPGVRAFLERCALTRRPVVVVSNNAAAAIDVFLERHELTDLVAGVLGRPYARPDLMKPHPFLADQARAILGRDNCCMIGDAPTDIEFSRRAGLPCIAYAKSARHEARLTAAGPDAVVRELTMLAEWI